MLSSLTVALVDNTPGLTPDQIAGLPVFVGACSVGTAGQIYSLSKDTNLKSVLGVGPLADALNDYFQHFDGRGGLEAYALAVPITAADTGTVGTADTTDVSGLATLTLGTECLMDAEVVIECTTGGASGAAKIRISLDNGSTWERTMKTVTTVVDIAIPDIGLDAEFDFTGGDMALGDVWRIKCTAPTITTASATTALVNMDDMGFRPEFVVVCCPTDSTDWAAYAAHADAMFALNRPLWCLCPSEAPTSRASADLTTWVNTLVADADEYAHKFVNVLSAYGQITERGGRQRWRMMTGVLAAFVARAQVNLSPGWVNPNPLVGIKLPEYFTQGMANSLSNARYTTARRWDGKINPRFDKALMMAEPPSKFAYLESIRVTFKAIRLAYQAALGYMLSPTAQEAGRVGPPEANQVGVAGMVGAMHQALSEHMLKRRPQAELWDFIINVPAGQNYQTNPVAIMLTLFGIPNLDRVQLLFSFDWGNPETAMTVTGLEG